MKALSLDDIRPQPAEFYLRKTDHTYQIRAVDLSDEVWLRHTFGARIQEILNGSDIGEMARIIWRLMSEQDRQLFPSVEVEETDESGNTRKIRKGGVQLLVESIHGPAEKIVIHRALLNTIGISKPIMDELSEAELKKNLPTGPMSPSAGEKYSTSSRQNTGGRMTKSGNSQPGKSPSRSKKSVSELTINSRSKRLSTESKSPSKRKHS